MRTGHLLHTALAASIWEAAGPVLPAGKKSSGSSSLHNALCTHSIQTAPVVGIGEVVRHCPSVPEEKGPKGRASILTALFPTQWS